MRKSPILAASLGKSRLRSRVTFFDVVDSLESSNETSKINEKEARAILDLVQAFASKVSPLELA